MYRLDINSGLLLILSFVDKKTCNKECVYNVYVHEKMKHNITIGV